MLDALNREREFFLNRNEKDTLAAWKYKVECPGILSALFNPFYEWVVTFIPRSVSPNVLSFAGLLFSIFAWQTSLQPDCTSPLSLAVIGTCIMAYMVLDDCDGKHARNTLNSSPLGELVDHFCDCITNGLLTSTCCNVFGLTDPRKVWLMVLFTGVKFAHEHLVAFADPEKILRFDRFTGPTEILVLVIAAVYGRNRLLELAVTAGFEHAFVVESVFRLAMVLFAVVVVQTLGEAYRNYRSCGDFSTLFAVIMCFLCQIVKFYISQPDCTRYIENGIIFSTLTADLIMAKMAGRHVHQLIPVFHMISVVWPITSVPLAILFFVVNVFDISAHMKISIVNPVRNVFVSGYYDGLHEGHIASLMKASRLGSKLTVGVHSDEDYMATKFDPARNNKLMNSLLTRASAVARLPFVDHVIPACPLTFNRDFLREYKIHAVGISDEYVYTRDALGRPLSVQKDYQQVVDRLVVIPRTPGISSSDLRKCNTFDQLAKLESLIKDIGAKVGAAP